MVRFEFETEKAIAALVYLASKRDQVPELDKYKAGKLLFLAEKYHLVRFGRPIFGDEYRALEHGPIPQGVVDWLHGITETATPQDPVARRLLEESLDVDRSFRHPRISARGAVNREALSESDIAALDHVVSLHGRKSFDELKALTHAMPAYRKAWNQRGRFRAASMAFEDFFEEDPDAIAGAYEEMVEDAALKQAFPGVVNL